jgi:hypothetical protein
MKSICLSCLLYTLKDKEVKDNLYLHIFYIWLAKVIQSGGLTENDLLQITMDKRTCEYLETNETILPILLNKLPCPFVSIIVDPPSNSLEGMMNKYVITNYLQDIFIYCDIDILISNSFHTLDEKLLTNTIYVCKEGILADSNYSGSYSSEITNKTLTGFSAGKFIVTGKELRDSFFNTIQGLCDYSKTFYTVEQPFFNLVVYKYSSSIEINILTEHVSFNGNDEYDKNKTIFNDMAGDVGLGESHVKRIMDAMALYLIGNY